MCPTVHGLGFVHCGQIAWKKWPTNWHAHVSRWLMLSCHWQLWVLLPMCLFFFVVFFFIIFSKVRVGAKEGGSHYWEMAVAITCGYGGYLLPLLAAHSSWHCKSINSRHLDCGANGLEKELTSIYSEHNIMLECCTASDIETETLQANPLSIKNPFPILHQEVALVIKSLQILILLMT